MSVLREKVIFIRFLKINSVRFFSCDGKSPAFETDIQVFLNFYKNYFDMGPTTLEKFLVKHPRLDPRLKPKSMDIQELKASGQFLKENFRLSEILEQPNILLLNRSTLSNRLQVMRECRFNEPHLSVPLLCRFVAIMNKNVSNLKTLNYIRPDADIPENLEKLLDIKLYRREKISEDIPLKNIREIIINLYLKTRLGMTEKQKVNESKTCGTRIKHRNFRDLVQVIDILQNRLNLTTDRILKNGFLITACPDNILELIEKVPKIGDTDIIEVLRKKPLLAMMNPTTVKNILDLLKSYNIPEERVLRDPNVLSLNYNTVAERFNDLKKVPEFEIFCEHPRFLSIIIYYNRAKMRLDYLKKLNLKCVSASYLLCSPTNFETHVKRSVDKTKGSDTVIYIAKAINMNPEMVREILIRHPHWCNVPVSEIKKTLNFLKEKKFTEKEIAENLILLLYPIKKIEQKLNIISETITNKKLLNGVDLSDISNSMRLNLTHYHIESEYHFTGDGIWDDDHNISGLSYDIPEIP